MSENDDPLEGAPVPSMGSLFDDPESTPPVVPARPAGSEGGRLYRSAHAVGPAAALAIQALPRPKPVDESLPLSPEAVAAAALSVPVPTEPASPAATPVFEAPAAETPDVAPAAQAPDGAPVTAGADEAGAADVQTVADQPEEAPAAVADGAAVAVAAAAPEAQAAVVAPAPAEMPIAPAAAPVAAQAWPEVPAGPIEPEVVAPVAVQPAAPTPAVLALPVAEPIAGRRLPTLTWTQATVLMVGVTIAAAIIDVLLRNGIGAVTGIGLLAATVFAGLRLRREDIWAAVVVPPLAFLAALVTVGQFAIGSTGGFVSRQALNIVTGLSLNAPWILGATAVGLVIVLVRRHREGPAAPQQPEATAAEAEPVPPVTTA